MLEKQEETHDSVLALVESVMATSSCVTEVQRFKTSGQLSDRLKELQPLPNDASDFVNIYHVRSSAKGELLLWLKLC